MRSDWEPATLGDYVELLTGFPFPSGQYSDSPKDVRLLRGDNIAQGTLRWDGAKRWPKSEDSLLGEYYLQKGDVVVAMDRPWIEAGLKFAALTDEDVPALLVQRVARLRGTRSLDTGFLRYLIATRAFTEHVLAVQTGTAVPHISAGQIRGFTFKLPPLADQRAIAQVLGVLDSKIKLNRRMNETLEAIARAIFKSWFVDFDPVRAKTTPKAATAVPREIALHFPAKLTASQAGMIPDKWGCSPLPQAIEVNPVRTLAKSAPAPYVDMGNLPTQSARVTSSAIREFTSGMRFKNGDTLVARITPCLENGKTAFVDFLEDGQVAWGSTEFIVLHPKPPLPPEYGYFLARSQGFREFAISNMTGTSGRQRVPTNCFDSFHIAVPPEPIATEFGKIGRTFFAKMKQNDEGSKTLAELRDALLPKLISGEVHMKQAEKIIEAHA